MARAIKLLGRHRCAKWQKMTKIPLVSKRNARVFRAPARRIIDAGERLIGELGVKNTSLLQVASAAGLTGKSAVQYHFGSREGLIRAILECRLPEVNEIRKRYLERATSEDWGDLSFVMYILFSPVMDHTNGRGQHRFAKFATRINLEAWDSIVEVTGREPHARLRALLTHLNDWEFSLRFSMIIAMWNAAVWQLDEQGADKKTAILGSFLAMAERALVAPSIAMEPPHSRE